MHITVDFANIYAIADSHNIKTLGAFPLVFYSFAARLVRDFHEARKTLQTPLPSSKYLCQS